jgi:2-polyprenyl-6-methoxyphenol hydroxylase-like FAD-dependent oxidoreductase
VRVIVVGGGIAGLSAAIGLRRSGHEVIVLERAPRIDPIGAGLTLFANAMSALDRLGMRDAVAAHGATAKRSAILTREGRELAHVPQDLLEGTIAIHRADLQRELSAAAGDVRLGAEITAVEQDDDGVVARGADGSEERGDLLVGADGLSSVVRSAIVAVRPRYAGYTAWRGVSPVPVEPGRLTESWGVGERFGLVDIGQGRTYWFATKNAPEGEPDEPEGKKAEILRRFSGWHEPIAAIADSTDEGAILRNDVYYLEPLPRWSEGRVVLVGDAAHATTRVLPRRSRTPWCSPTGSRPAASSRLRSASTRRSGDRGRRPCSSSPVASTRPPSSRAHSAGESGTPSSAGSPNGLSAASWSRSFATSRNAIGCSGSFGTRITSESPRGCN